MKINIILSTKDEGCNYYRLWLPHKDMEGAEFVEPIKNELPEDYDCDILVSHHKTYNLDILRQVKKQGIKLVIDYDDWIIAPDDHIFRDEYNGHYDSMVEQLKLADLVTTTSEKLREELYNIYPANIVVIPNALNKDELPIKQNRIIPDSELTFGYTGGMCHLPDVKELTGLMRRLQVDYTTRNKFYFALAGYYDKNNQTDDVRKAYLNILSDDRKYNRVKVYPKLRATDYLNIYNVFDVSLIPLQDNVFNNCKSEIKLIESGYFNRAVICSDVQPYSSILTDKNSIRISNRFQWYKSVKYLIQNRNKVKDLGAELNRTIEEKFDLKKWNQTRLEIYKNLL